MSNLIQLDHQMIIDDVNAKNASNLTVDELIFSKPQENDGSWTDDQLNGNTLMRLTPKEESDFIGTTVIAYNRIPMTNLFTMLNGAIRLPEEVLTVHEAIPFIEASFGIKFYVEDLVDQLIDRTNPEAPTVELAAQPDSPGWTGEATFGITTILPSIGSALDTSSVKDIATISDTTKRFAESLVYWNDFSNEFDYLSGIQAGHTDMAEFARMLSEVTQTDWRESSNNTHTLRGAEVVFAGLNDGSVLANNNYKYVIHIQLNKDGTATVLEYEGNVIIHFNDPNGDFDPGEV